MNKREIVQDFLNKTAKNKIEEYAIIEEIGEPLTPTDDLPNLKKDRIVLELVNRTNSDSIIDVLGLPAGVNTSQGIDLSRSNLPNCSISDSCSGREDEKSR